MDTEKEPKYCGNCAFYINYSGVCINADSDYRADFRLKDDDCKEWTEINDKKH